MDPFLLNPVAFQKCLFSGIFVFNQSSVLQVIKTLDPKQPAVSPDIQALKNQLTEKERKIQHLEVFYVCALPLVLFILQMHIDARLLFLFIFAQHDFEKSRVRHDQEEKLIISAWYNMVSTETLPHVSS